MMAPIHVIMRFSNKLTKIDDTIEAHNIVLKQHSSVWFGKLGKPFSLTTIDKINNQCKEGVPTYLYLVQSLGSTYQVFRGRIMKMASSLPKNEKHLIPAYYTEEELIKFMRLWTKLSSIESLQSEALNHLSISESLMAVRNTLQKSMAGLFIVRMGKGIDI